MWIPLHLHSQYSILDAACSLEGIAKKAKELGIPAVALTDHGNLHGAVDFYKACTHQGIKPIIGCEAYVAPLSRFEKKKTSSSSRTAYHLTLLAKDDEGYRNLCRLSSLGYLEGFYYHPRIDKELLQKYHKGLICLSGCLSSMVSQAALHGTEEELLREIEWHRQLFQEDFYLELQRHSMTEENVDKLGESWLVQHYREFISHQQKVNAKLIDCGQKLGIKVVATNDTHYLEPKDWQAHEILLNIQSGEPCEIWEKDSSGNETFRIPNPKRRVYASRELYFKSAQEMQTLFSDLPEALSSTLEIGEKCQLELDFETRHYPVYIPPALEGKSFSKEERAQAAEKFLTDLCEEHIPKRYIPEVLARIQEKYPENDPLTIVRDRLRYELEVITSKGMCDYLLIVWDFINWAKKNAIPVGPGRGSGTGSIVLYLIGVTDIEPLRFSLFFERFINPERVSYPDIDVDICMDRRNEVIDYTVRKYGKENVAQIITFGTMKAKMTIKDVGRVLSVPLSKVNAIAKLIPEDPNMTLERALEIDPDLNALYLSDSDAKRIIDLGKTIEGSIRSSGIHAAGIIICADPLMDHIPICLPKDSDMVATQYSMKPVEAVGMLKIDFLGLKTLTSIRIAVDAIKENRGIAIDWVHLPLDNPQTFRLLQEGKTQGVFQMESGGMQDLATKLRPDRFEEIIAIGALYRPGPMEMIPSYINRKHKREAIEYDHPKLQSILAETYGIIVYQEQVMQIAQELANYTLGEGDAIRKAMGKKDKVQMAREREKFNKGTLENGIPEEIATVVFDRVEKFAAYGFNKSHAAGYAYLTYVTAYLKANFSKEWMAALLTCDRDDVSKVAKLIRECQAMEISILPPDINEAGKTFTAAPQGIRFAMTGIKGVGEGVVEAILEERKARGPFKNFYDFFKRIDLSRVGKKAIEHLVDAGCFDFTEWTRDALRESIEEMYDCSHQEQKESQAGVMTLFSLMGNSQEKRFQHAPKVQKATSRNDALKREKELLGFFLTGHPMDAYKNVLESLSCIPLCGLEQLNHNTVVRAAFIVEAVQIKIASKTQKKFAVLMISDGMESYELPIWSELFDEKASLLQENQLLYAVLQIDKREETLRLSCRWFDDLTKIGKEMMEACDRAFDRAKLQVNRFSQNKEYSAMKPKEQKEQQTPFLLKLDIDKTRHSQILKLKEIFRSFPGSHQVSIEFYNEGKCFAKLNTRLAISPNEQFDKQLRAVFSSL